MRRLENDEIIEYIEIKLDEEGYFVEDSRRLARIIEESILYNDEYETDDDGNIKDYLTEEEIRGIKTDMLEGIKISIDEGGLEI